MTPENILDRMCLVDRIIKGLEILKTYNPELSVNGAKASWILECQDVEFSDMTDDDRASLYQMGWRNREAKPLLWFCVDDQGLQSEKTEPARYK